MAKTMVSVITTVLNEERHIGELIESLKGQEGPFEFIVVDAKSRDRTVDIVKSYIDKGEDWITLIIEPGTRGHCFNIGIDAAKGEIVSFIGGDGIARKDWIANVRKLMDENQDSILVGKVVLRGYMPFKELERVELRHKGFDISYPGNNTSYPTRVLRELDGIDPYFITAEDIDLNFRAIDLGYKMVISEEPVIYHKVREGLNGFVKQAFWNGYGRKQLTVKHGMLWSDYSFNQMVIQKMGFWKLLRLFMATIGYVWCKVTGEVPDFDNRARRLKTYIAPKGPA